MSKAQPFAISIVAVIALTQPVVGDDSMAPSQAKPARSASRVSDPPKSAQQTSTPGNATDTMDARAKSIYDRAVAAARKLKVIGYDCEVSGVEGLDRDDARYLRARPVVRVLVEFPPDEELCEDGYSRFRVASLEHGHEVVTIIYDGRNAVVLDEKSKSCTLRGCAVGITAIGPLYEATPRWCKARKLDALYGAPPTRLVAASVVGVETLDGTPCDIVRVVREIGSTVERAPGEAPAWTTREVETLAIARSDSIPRRIASTSEDLTPKSEPRGQPTLAFTSVKVDPKLKDDQFTAACPAGFTKIDQRSDFPGPTEPQGASELVVKVGDKAPDFKLRNLAGQEVSMASFSGKVVLLHFWTSRYGDGVVQNLSETQKVYEAFKNKGLVVLGVASDPSNAAKDFSNAKKLAFDSLGDAGSLSSAYGVQGVPTLVLIGRDGKIAWMRSGRSRDGGKALGAAIEAALAKAHR